MAAFGVLGGEASGRALRGGTGGRTSAKGLSGKKLLSPAAEAPPGHAVNAAPVSLTGVFLGAAVHLKVYPAVFAPAFACALWVRCRDLTASPAGLAAAPAASDAKDPASMAAAAVAARAQGRGVGRALRLFFRCAVAATFGGLLGALTPTALSYFVWGQRYWHDAVTYHLGRVDHRHNLAPHFLPMYLEMARSHICAAANATAAAGGPTRPEEVQCDTAFPLGLVAFLPQAAGILAVAVRLRRNVGHQVAVTTVLFVAFNKVCTVQYFVWFLPLLPLVFATDAGVLRAVGSLLATQPQQQANTLAPPVTTPGVAVMGLRGALAVGGWVVALIAWMLVAKSLEFDGEPGRFRPLWACSLAYFAAQVAATTVLARTAVRAQTPAKQA